nr:integrase, catalytic region, zinc finger, CCHC-type, peptidase aspartic, catalytic [Tanacetum cinerariifolium]
MTRNRSRLKNFVKKFIGTVKFGNDHFGAIVGYGDYVIGIHRRRPDGPDPGVNRVALAGLNPEPTHEEFMANVYPDVHGSLKLPANEHVILEEPLSLFGTLSSIKNLDDAYTLGDQFLNDKSTEDEPGKLNMDSEVVFMVTVPIYQASSLVPTLSTPIIDLSPPKPVPATTQAPIFTATTTTTTTLLLPPPSPQQNLSDSELAALFKVAVHIALQAPLEDRFRELPEADMKEILHQRIFKSGSCKLLPEHAALYEALEASMDRANRDEFLAEKDMSRKRRHDDQEDPSKKRRHDLGTSGPTQPPSPQSSTWKTSDTRETPSNFSRKKSASHSKQPIEEAHMPDTVDISNSEDTDSAHLPKIKPRLEWIGKKKLSKYDLEGPTFKDLEYLVSCDKGKRLALSISKLKAAHYLDFGLEELVSSLWNESEHVYDISAAYGISHWWFKRKEFYITRHYASSNCSQVRSHMQILSIISLKTYERYGYAFLKEIFLRRADYKENKISKADFRNLHPNDFEDLYLLYLQDYTIVSKPMAVIYIDRKDQKKMMRETKVHKFNDGTLNRILDKLDHMVKDFKLYEYNPGMETRIWYEDDRRRINNFMEVIERRLKIRRIFRSLKSFVGGRLRDVDYRLIQRTE